MAVVVRCPACRGEAQVGPEAIGLLVVCPRCSEPFLAAAEAVPIGESANGRPGASRPRRARAEPVAPARQPLRRRRHQPAEPAPAQGPDPHDPPPPHSSGLPASVLVGLALLPFAIPLLW